MLDRLTHHRPPVSPEERPTAMFEAISRLFGKPERPSACVGLKPAIEMCGDSPEQAMSTLLAWEELTLPRRRV